tara:strand:+ start:2434 stop:2631 length:198 start_codon:yes stop_codon:yes gene_type:complete
MRKTEFIQKYLGNAEYPFCDANREAMYDDLCAVIESHIEELPKDLIKLKYLLDMPSRNQNSDFSL